MKNKFSQKTMLVGMLVIGIAIGSVGIAQASYSEGQERGERMEQRSEILDSLSEEQRATLKEAHELRKSRDKDAAKLIIDESGIAEETIKALHVGAKKHGKHPKNEEAKSAVANNDYQAFVTATLDSPRAGNVSEDTFGLLVQAYESREAGDKETAHEIMKQIHEIRKTNK